MSYKELASIPSNTSQDENDTPQAKSALKIAQTTVDSLQVGDRVAGHKIYVDSPYPILYLENEKKIIL